MVKRRGGTDMRKYTYGVVFMIAILIAAMSSPQQAYADTAAELDKKAKLALQNLYDNSKAARDISKKAKGILVFPSIKKAGLMIGGQYGEGALLVDGKAAERLATPCSL
jgi:lipid-binding SYLF domain-containing protein